MLEYTTNANLRPSLGVFIHQTDAEREAGPRGWTVVDMSADWNTVFGQ